MKKRISETPSIRRMAGAVGKSPGTIHRWKTTNPALFQAVAEYVARLDSQHHTPTCYNQYEQQSTGEHNAHNQNHVEE